MALDQSALLEVLDALRTADAGERITQAAETIYQALIDAELTAQRNCQDLWIGVFQATSVSADSAGSGGVMSTGRSSSLPLWKTAPARTRATRCGALTALQRACAASISL